MAILDQMDQMMITDIQKKMMFYVFLLLFVLCRDDRRFQVK